MILSNFLNNISLCLGSIYEQMFSRSLSEVSSFATRFIKIKNISIYVHI